MLSILYLKNKVVRFEQRRRQERNQEAMNEDVYEDDASPAAKYKARQLFHEAYQEQLAENFEEAIELYKRSIETYPTAEAHTFLGWVYSFQNRYDEAIEECLEAIRVDETLGNPYNDIGSYLLAKGKLLRVNFAHRHAARV